MGPVEENLRAACKWASPFGAAMELTEASWHICMGAARNLRVPLTELAVHWPDVMSEAVEAAEALGL